MTVSKKTDSKKVESENKSTSKKIEGNKPRKRIYIGPNLTQVMKYTVLENEEPVHIKELIKECPAVGKLLVPLEQFVESEKKCSEKGTLEHKRYKDVLNFANGRSEG